jgi:MSHA pilin protein MshC
MTTNRNPQESMRWQARQRVRQRGFTLVELIMVIVILGVLAVYATASLNTTDFEARGFHDETLALLRYAQKTAIAQRRTVCVTFDPTGVALSMDTTTIADSICDVAPTQTPTLPNTPRGGTGLAVSPALSVTPFQFTPLGSTNQTSNVTITIANSTGITIEASTGYVHE